jgi:hypothetical protein
MEFVPVPPPAQGRAQVLVPGPFPGTRARDPGRWEPKPGGGRMERRRACPGTSPDDIRPGEGGPRIPAEPSAQLAWPQSGLPMSVTGAAPARTRVRMSSRGTVACPVRGTPAITNPSSPAIGQPSSSESGDGRTHGARCAATAASHAGNLGTWHQWTHRGRIIAAAMTRIASVRAPDSVSGWCGEGRAGAAARRSVDVASRGRSTDGRGTKARSEGRTVRRRPSLPTRVGLFYADGARASSRAPGSRR